MESTFLSSLLKKHRPDFHPVVPFDPVRGKLFSFDFTDKNTALRPEQIADTERFSDYILHTLKQHNANYGIGGYNEHRTLYARSKHFDHSAPVAGSEAAKEVNLETETEPRRLHLGIDIWGPASTKVMSPLDGIIHSFAFNNNDSDYGATLVLTHNLEGISFHTLYGHLSLNSLKNLIEGEPVMKGQVIAEFGMRFENGNWPSHLHFQLISDMQGWKGDYPGVCKFSERASWLGNCPDPDLILHLNRYLK
jgi:peptidoglycan LD-endopeptidase LytH